jgi:hypothetical protein
LLLQSAGVQTRLVYWFTEKIEAETGVRIIIGGVDFRPLKSLVLNDILVKDFRNDTLLYARNAVMAIDSVSLFQRSFKVKELTFEDAYFNLWMSRGDKNSVMNLEVMLDSLSSFASSSDKSESSGGAWVIDLEKIKVRNSRFTYREEKKDSVFYEINWTDVDCRELNVDILRPNFSGDETFMDIRGLSFKEKSGFEVKEIDGVMKLRSGHLDVSGIKIKTERSDLHLKSLQFDWKPNNGYWRNFTSRMEQRYEVAPSEVSFEDLAYFNEGLLGIRNVFTCEGVVTGTVNKLKGTNLRIELGEKTVIEGDAESSGLPSFFTALFDINIRSSSVYPPDLETLYLPWMDYWISIPKPFHAIGVHNISGRFNGTIEDFVFKANSTTRGAHGDAVLHYASTSTGYTLDGNLSFPGVNVGRLMKVDGFGNADFAADFTGKFNDDTYLFDLEGQINSMYYKGTSVGKGQVFLTADETLLDISAEFADEKFKSELHLKQSNDSVPELELKGKFDIADLNDFQLGINQKTREHCVGKLAVNIKGDLEHRADISAYLTDLSYHTQTQTPDRGFRIDTIRLDGEKDYENYSMALSSDVVDFKMSGIGAMQPALRFLNQQLCKFLPVFKSPDTNVSLPSNVHSSYLFSNKDLNRVLNVIYPDFNISSGANINLRIEGSTNKFAVDFVADTLIYKGINFSDASFKVDGKGDKLTIVSTLGKIDVFELFTVHNLHNELRMHDDEIDSEISWCNWSEKTYSGNLSANVKFLPSDNGDYKTRITINPGIVVMSDSVWRVNSAVGIIENGKIKLEEFSVVNNNQYMGVSGDITENPKDVFSIKLKNIDLFKLNKMLFTSNVNTFGMVNGEIHFQNNLLHSDIQVKDWGVNSDTVGVLNIVSYWEPDSGRLVMKAENFSGDDIPFYLSGYYQPSSDSIHLNLNLKEFDLQYMNRYTSSVYSNGKGRISGNLHINGNPTDFDVNGYVALDSVSMLVNDLNTVFSVRDSLFFSKNDVYFKDFEIKDRNGNTALLNGSYDIIKGNYNFDISCNNFLVMNNGPEHSDQLYGRVYLTSLINVNGADGVTNVRINARPEWGSELYLPLSAATNIEENNFLHFVNTNQYYREDEKSSKFDMKNVILNANLELNDNLKVYIVFDPLIGDVLHASGSGDIKIELDNNEGISMLGEYKLSQGNYTLTLGGLMDKSFNLKPGGTIVWNGAPYDAVIDVAAVYNLKTSLNELFTDGNTAGNEDAVRDRSTKVPVECILDLSGNITNPTVVFDINFPSLDAQAKSYVQNLFASEDEKNKQMFSLLMLNRFTKPDHINVETENTNVGRQAGMTTVSEILSNQLSRWLSGINNNFGVDFVYRPGDEISADEVELALSTQLLNDRLSISVNGNMDVGSNRNVENASKNNVIGDFDIELKINEEGSLKLKAYSHTDEKIIYKTNNETTQGIGVSYQESFDTFRELFNRYLGFLKKKNRKTD